MAGADEPSRWIIVTIGVAAIAGLALSIAVLAHSGQTRYCPKPNPLPTWLVPAAAALSFLVFLATIPERVRCQWDKTARTIQAITFVALVLCFFAWTTGGVAATNCGD